MSNLQSAIRLALQGFKVFPVAPGKKVPALPGDFNVLATTDLAIVDTWWRNNPQYNIGVSTNDLIVLDLDVKSNINGVLEYERSFNYWDTFTVKTPSGGLHLYFKGEPCRQRKVSEGIDVRSINGYVLGPGSVLPAGTYTVVNGTVIKPVPSNIASRLTYTITAASAPVVTTPNEARISNAKVWLDTEAPIAIQGAHGDDTTYYVCCKLVRDFALFPDDALSLLADVWNPRCVPPWDLEDLAGKIENARQYGVSPFGAALPPFGAVDVPPIPPPARPAAVTGGAWGNAVDPETIPRRAWQATGLALRGAVTTVAGPGGVGKSTLGVGLAARFALGRDFGPYKIAKPCKVVVYNGEDDIHEQSRRLAAVCMLEQVDYNTTKQNIAFLDEQNFSVRLAYTNGRSMANDEEVVNDLIAVCSPEEVGVLMIDPFEDTHELSENEASHMKHVMRILKHIAVKANVAVLVFHHTNKAPVQGEDSAGNAKIFRGNSAIINRSRAGFTLVEPSQSDRERYGLAPHENYVRLDDAKMNYAKRHTATVWLHHKPVALTNGDSVNVLVSYDMSNSETALKRHIAALLHDYMVNNGTASLPLVDAVTVLTSNDPMFAAQPATSVRTLLQKVLNAPVQLATGAFIRFVRKQTGKKSELLVVME